MARSFSLLFCFLLAACVPSGSVRSPVDDGLQKFARGPNSDDGIGCKKMMDSYCTRLYSPEALGNLLIDRVTPIKILQGETKNHFSQKYYKYAQAKIRNRDFFPRDFRENLNRSSYFEKLDEYIHRPPITRMTIDERIRSDHLQYEISLLWRNALDETILRRMSEKFKGFHRIPDRAIPIEYDVEERRMRRKLISEVSRIIWREDANWKKVVNGFNELKESFYTVFERLDAPPELIASWKEKIRTVELVLPGSLPEISDEECATTTINAYYYKYLNLLTVCAGDFNSEDIFLTLAHEMGHALDIDRDLYVYLKNSELSRNARDLRSAVCQDLKTFDCGRWEKFKEGLPAALDHLKGYQPPLAEFNRCLKKNPAAKSPDSDDLDRISEKIIRDRIASLAGSDIFLRLIKEKIPLRNGHEQKNPNYFNPCSYYLWTRNEEPVDDEIYTLVYFAAEYKCSAGDSPSQRLQSAIETAKKVSTQVQRSVLEAEGEFSGRSELVSEGLGSPPSERFADVVGTYALAEHLKVYGNIWDRRTKMLASSSWLCEEPSIASTFPEESKIERNYSLDSHTQGEDRKAEVLSQPIREVLSCQQDFEFRECKLPLKGR